MILRELFISLGLQTDEASFAHGQLAANVLTEGLKELVKIGTEVVRNFADNVKSSVEYGNKIEKTAQSVGIAADALQELHYAGHLVDLSAEQMSQSIGLFSRKMKEAKDGSEQAAKAFSGIKFLEGGKLRATDEVLASVADKFQKMPDGAEKTGLAMQLFGRAGKQMIPFLNKGAEGLAEMRKEARDLGLVMGKDAIRASVELDENMKRLSAVTEGLWRQAIAPLLPAISDLVKRFLAWRMSTAAIMAQKIKQFVSGVIWAINKLADVFEFLNTNSTAFLGILAGLMLGLVVLKAAAIQAAIATAIAWLPVIAPFAAIAAAVTALMLIFDDLRVYFSKSGDSLTGRAVEGFKKFFTELNDAMDRESDDDPWFIVMIRSFRDLVIEVRREWESLWNSRPGKAIRAVAAAPGDALDYVAQAVNKVKEINYTAGHPDLPSSMGDAYTPRYRTIEGTGVRALAPEQRNTFHITQQPGESGEDLATRIADKLGFVKWSDLEDAHAAAPAPGG